MAAVAAAIKTNMEGLLEKCSDKITEFVKMEKQICQFAESIAEKCEAMVDKVTKTAGEQVIY